MPALWDHAVRIDLPAASHRDPSGLLPAAADAARQRRFNDEAIVHAVRAGKLVVARAPDDLQHTHIVDLVRAERLRQN